MGEGLCMWYVVSNKGAESAFNELLELLDCSVNSKKLLFKGTM